METCSSKRCKRSYVVVDCSLVLRAPFHIAKAITCPSSSLASLLQVRNRLRLPAFRLRMSKIAPLLRKKALGARRDLPASNPPGLRDGTAQYSTVEYDTARHQQRSCLVRGCLVYVYLRGRG